MLTSCKLERERGNISIPGVDGPKISLTKDSLLIAMILKKTQLQIGMRYSIPKYPNSYIEVTPDLLRNGTLLAFSISIEDILGLEMSLSTMESLTLPGGRPLPGVRRGKMPAISVKVRELSNITFYLSKKAFALFIPLRINTTGSATIEKYYFNKKKIGKVNLIPMDHRGRNAGVFLYLETTKDVRRAFKKRRDHDLI